MNLLATVAITVLPWPGQPVDTTLRIQPGTTVEVSSFSQPILVTGTSGNELTVKGASVDVGQRRIEVDGQMFGTNAKGPIVIQLPTSARLVIGSVSGAITVTNAPDHVEVDAFEGPVRITGGRGTLQVSGTGSVSVDDFLGERLSIDGLAGGITVRGASGSIAIESVNGPIALERISGRNVQVSSVNGQIRWQGGFEPTGRYEIESHNGGIELTVPATIDARIRIETFNGGFSSEIPASVSGAAEPRRGPPQERNITAIYGRGQATIDITVFNGGVQVRRLGGT